jgi:hypothetical protein
VRHMNCSNSLCCEQCNGSLNKFCFLSLRKYEIVGEGDDYDEYLVEAHNFCSEECVNKFLERSVRKDFTLYKISRCVGYYDCQRLDNIRRMCEDKEELTSQKRGLFLMPNISPLNRRCEPAQVGIIKSSLALLDLFESYKSESSEINKQFLENAKEAGEINKQILTNTRQSGEVNKQMLKYTKHLTILTVLIAFFTVVNIVLIVYKIVEGF